MKKIVGIQLFPSLYIAMIILSNNICRAHQIDFHLGIKLWVVSLSYVFIVSF